MFGGSGLMLWPEPAHWCLIPLINLWSAEPPGRESCTIWPGKRVPEQNILLQTLDTRWQRHGSESGLRTALVYFFVLTTCGLAIWLTLSLGSGLRTDAGRGSVVSPVAVRLDYQSGIQTIARMLSANLRQPLGILLLQLI